MKSTKCDRCGVTNDNRKGGIRFDTLKIKIGYEKHFKSKNQYDICEKCQVDLDIDTLMLKVISKYIREMPEEKG